MNDHPEMKPRYTPFEAARRLLTLVTLDGGEDSRRFVAFVLARADSDPYVRTIKDIVDAELPFWEMLKAMPDEPHQP